MKNTICPEIKSICHIEIYRKTPFGDSYMLYDISGIAPTLLSAMGMGGGKTPYILEIENYE